MLNDATTSAEQLGILAIDKVQVGLSWSLAAANDPGQQAGVVRCAVR